MDTAGELSEAKRAERQIVDVLESMSDAFFSVDENWIITRVNATHEKSTHYARADQIGKNLLELFFQMPEARASKYWVSYHKVMNERVPVAFEEYYPPFDLWTQVRAYPTPDGGMAVFFTDTTEQKKISQRIEAEKHKFESIFVDSPAPMALLRGPTFVFEKVNTRYKELLGGRELVGKPLLEALPELEDQPFHALMKRVYETGEPFHANEMRALLRRKPGGELEETFLDFTYSRVDDGVGQAYGVYIHAVDNTEKVLARKRIEQLALGLQKAVNSRDEFLSIASHELKTPLTSLKLQWQMTQRAVQTKEGSAASPERLARTLAVSARQLDRLTSVIEDLLDVSRIEAGRMQYHFEPVDLAGLAAEVVERLSEQLKAAGCALTLAAAEGTTVVCDRFRIEQVLTNLLTNAAKYGAGGAVSVIVSPSSGGASITVTDRGMGIASESQSRIFDRFERAISHNNISGLGLGLYITRQIVESHRGSVRVRSAPGEGSTFTVDLPKNPQ
jgi:PAS domain S-box-containing protein